ncbi:MAG: peptidoglycan-binding domain-containing protein [Cyanobacteria bacterium P01_H01_bin.119]
MSSKILTRQRSLRRLQQFIRITLALATGGTAVLADLDWAIAAAPVTVWANTWASASAEQANLVQARPNTAPKSVTDELPLSLGAQGTAVEQIQTRLQRQGYQVGAIDGLFGPQTLAAVSAFQRVQSLEPDGIVDLETWQKLMPQPAPLPSTDPLFRRAQSWVPSGFGLQPLLLPGQDRIPPSPVWLLLIPCVPMIGGVYFYLIEKLKTTQLD